MASKRRVALVTGGAKRVGRAIVERLAAGGFDVAFTYLRSGEEAKALVGALKRKKHTALAIQADLLDPERASQKIHDGVIDRFGRLDVLVNSASLYEAGGLGKASAAQAQRLWSIHVAAPMLLCQRFERTLRERRGHVVNMVDLLAERPWPEYLAYCASKAGLWNLTLGLARALAPEVTVNGIAPGVVEWPAGYPKEERERYLRRVPLGRAGTPEDVAELVHFLVTAGEGGSYITGQIIRLDGGRSIT
ncbi:MAG TPA: SDR family oxidoreductase [Tepidisphaeraceae bacterium]|jgi:pteridine reductase